MTDDERPDRPAGAGVTRPRRVRIPGFVRDEELGLGDAIKHVTSAMGIRPCGGCERRAAALNRRLVLTRGRSCGR
jgi:hypothetical protein